MLDYYQAAVPDGWQILGVKLRPLSLGHLILLKRYGSAFVVGGIPTEADLVLTYRVCYFELVLIDLCVSNNLVGLNTFSCAGRLCR